MRHVKSSYLYAYRHMLVNQRRKYIFFVDGPTNKEDSLVEAKHLFNVRQKERDSFVAKSKCGDIFCLSAVSRGGRRKQKYIFCLYGVTFMVTFTMLPLRLPLQCYLYGYLCLYDITFTVTFAANESRKTGSVLRLDPFIFPRAKAAPGLLLHFPHSCRSAGFPAGSSQFQRPQSHQTQRPEVK